MKLFNVFAAFLFIGMLNNAEAQKRTIAGVEFPTIMKINKKVVTLNGGGLREKYTIDLYVVGLYLRNPSMNAKKIMTADEEMAMKIEIVSNKVTRDKFVESVKEGFEKSPGATAQNINQFMKFFSDPFKKGDKIIMVYKPGIGTVFYKNKEKRGVIKEIPSEKLGVCPFKSAMFGIWIGDKPASKKLKQQILGKI